MGKPTTPATVRTLIAEASSSQAAAQRFTPLQSEPFWNGCGQPTAIHACVLVKHRARQVLTAIRTLDNHLRLFSWRVNADGAILCTGTTDAQVHDVMQIDLVRAHKYVSACRTGAGAMHLQCWDVGNTGEIYASGPMAIVSAAFTWLQLLVLAPDRVLTIGLGADGLWHISSWAIADYEAPRPLDHQAVPAVTGALAATVLTATDGVGASPIQSEQAAAPMMIPFATVMHTAPDRLCWQRWHCLPNGKLQLQTSTEQPYSAIVDLALTTVNGMPVTLLHSATGRLQVLHGWPASAPTDSPAEAVTLADHVRLFTVTNDGEQLMIAHVTARPTAAQATTAPEATDETLPELTTVEMHRWQPAAQQWITCGSGTLPIPTATELALCNQPLDGNAPFLTAIGTAAGALHLVTWGDTMPAPTA